MEPRTRTPSTHNNSWIGSKEQQPSPIGTRPSGTTPTPQTLDSPEEPNEEQTNSTCAYEEKPSPGSTPWNTFVNTNWDDLKKEFLDAYAPRYTARTLCVTLQELRQRSEENVQDYYNRVSDAFRNAYKEKPDALKNFDGTDAQRGGANPATANLINLLGVQKMQLHMMNTIFIGGLRDELRSKVLEDEDEIGTMQDAVKRARSLEVIITEKKMRGTIVASVEAQGDTTPVKPEEPVMDDKMKETLTQLLLRDEEKAIAAIGANDLRHRLNQRRNQRGQGRGGGGNRGNFNGKNQTTGGGVFVCWYCNIPGHTQANCHKRQSNGGAYSNKGKNLTVHSVSSRRDENNSFGRSSRDHSPDAFTTLGGTLN